jgi:SAM-dependent methyltransferase
MKNQLPDYWPMLKAYHRAREPLYRTIIADCGLPIDGLILDAGCGDAFYSRLIAEVLGGQVSILAVDYNLATLRSQLRPTASLQLCVSDIERAGLRRGAFDVVWMCRAMHSVNDPQRRLSTLAALLRPGGHLIVIENDLAHCPILSWPIDFEHRVQVALNQALTAQSHNGASIDRYYSSRFLPAWLAHAGLRQITMHTYPVEDVAPMTPEVETYWQLLMNFRGDLLRPYLSTADRLTHDRAFNPACPDYLLNRPGFYCLEPTTVAYGTAP